MGTLKSRSGEIVEMSKRKLVNICSVLETRFGGTSVRMISGKAVEYNLFWIENEKGLERV